jgi:hypothetical protein
MKKSMNHFIKRTLFILVLGVSSAVFAGCTPSSDALSSLSQLSCLPAIPVGREIVGDRARFAGLRSLSVGEFLADFTYVRNGEKYRPKHLTSLLGDNKTLCVVAWRGSFLHLEVDKPKIIRFFAQRGPYAAAVTAVSPSGEKLLFVVLSSRFNFGFSKIFPHVFDTPVLR